MHLGPLIPVIGNRERITRVERAAGQARAGVLADGAAPLQLQLGQIARPLRASEYSGVDAAERQVDDPRQVVVLTAHEVLERFVRKWEGRNQAQRSCQAGASIVERLQLRSDFL